MAPTFVLVAYLVLQPSVPTAGLGQGADDGVDRALRRALVVGIDAYPDFPLRNAVNDARAIARQLAELGFAVELVLDADRLRLERSATDFIGKLERDDVALFFYSGHGIQIQDVNFLLPVDHDLQNEADAKDQAFSAGRLLRRIEARDTRLNILILDACRDNPYKWIRSGGEGLAHMNAGKGTFIAFATAPGQTASDNPRGQNGLFTSYLLETLKIPDLRLEEVFNQVRRQVLKASNGRQLPWSTSTVIGEFRFRSSPVITGETVSDTATGLMWLRRVSVINSTHRDAEVYCRELRAGGYLDWRLPLRSELRSVYDKHAPKGTALGGRIEVPEVRVWIADTQYISSEKAFYFSFKNGKWKPIDKASWSAGALCVRTEVSNRSLNR